MTLAGHVGSYTEKFNAENAALRVAGVKALAVEMDVKLPASGKRNDSDIARTAESVLSWTTYFSPENLKVKVEGGWITLSGEVQWDFQRQALIGAVRHLLGVTGVTDSIVIKPDVSATLVKSDIEASLKRRAKADAQKISVHVLGGDVTLTGEVNSWSEKNLARNSAWGTPGVRNVVDNMTVSY